MPLILAIEPDRRQAAQLQAVVKRRLDAELILVDTTERALDAIGNRMPDLVLVPALLSPQDDAALAAALRVIAAAAHVQMLTIPVLGSAKPVVQKVGGVLSALRRGKSRVAETDGCDPAVFAEQIASYLERVEEERPSAAPVAAPAAASDAVTASNAPARAEPVDAFKEFAEAAVESPAPPAAEPEMFATAAETEAAPLAATSFEPAAIERMPEPEPESRREESGIALTDESVSWALEEAVRALFSGSEQESSDEPRDAGETGSFEDAVRPEAIVSAEPDAAIEPAAAWADAEAMAASAEFADAPAASSDTAPVVVPEVESDVVVPDVEASPLAAIDHATLHVEAEVPADELAVAPLEQMDVEPADVQEPAPEPVVLDEWGELQKLIAALDAMPLAAIEATTEDEWIAPVVEDAAHSVPKPAAAARQPEPEGTPASAAGRSEREWVALIESLRHDVERLRTERAEKPAKKAAAPKASRPEPPRPEAPRQDRKAKPIQDEWGFFDPEQCGFAALLAKLDEVTDSEDNPETS